jgi:AbrB family looped-hinge helix DNA binding protein
MEKRTAKIGKNGRITLPAAVWRHLGVGPSDSVDFVFLDDGKVELRPVQFTLESVLGSIEALPNETYDLDAEIELAVEAATAERYRRL